MNAAGPLQIASLAADTKPCELYFDGGWHAARSGQVTETRNPATGEVLGFVHQAGVDDVDLAVAAARRAWPGWRALKPQERSRLLRACAEAIRRHAEELAMLDALDGGNPVAIMAHDIAMAAEQIDYFAGLALEQKGYSLPLAPDRLHLTQREPLGVVAKIAAYNHPFMFVAGKMAPPLVAGNVVIAKPPEQAPLSSLRLAELLHDILPPGVFSVLPGGRECGAALSGHPGIGKVSLIGSVAVGKAILRAAAETVKPVSLELGGKNALIAFPDHAPETIADAAIRGMNFAWCGQSCGSTSRIFVHDDIHDAVVEAIAAKVAAMKPGLPSDPATTMGCLISQAQLDKVARYVEIAKMDGARLVVGGKRPAEAALKNGFFFEPTVFADVTPGMRIAREEVFGPIMSVLRWRDYDAMIAAVNDVEYGLTCAIWTQDLALAHETAQAVEAGYVWVNDVGAHYLGMPFAGWKQSGLGEEENLAELLGYTRSKTLNIRFRA